MKFIKYLLYILSLSMFISACSPEVIGDPMPLYFDSEEQLIKAIMDVKGGKTSATDDVLTIQSTKAHQQSYNVNRDEFNLVKISEFYRPVHILKGSSLTDIIVNNYYVSYHYSSEDNRDLELATFTWFREMSPEETMNGLSGRGASVREIEYQGSKYVFLEWADPETHKSSGYTIFWAADGKAYQASIPSGYTDDEMLAFCQFETVPVK